MKIKKKKLSFYILIIILVISLIGAVTTQKYSLPSQLVLLFAANCLYLTGALLYHHKDKSLTLSLYLEYLLTAALGLVLLFGLYL